MRIITVLFFLCFLGLSNVNSQMAIGNRLEWKKAEALDDDLLKAFKATKTVFITRSEDDNESYQGLLEKVWTITPLEVVSYAEVDQYLGKSEYSFFEIQSTTIYNEKNNSSCTYIYLSLYFNEPQELGEEPYPQHIAKMELHPDAVTLFGDYDSSFSDHVYNKATLYNWEKVTLINYFKQVNDHLKKRKGKAFYDRMDSDKQLKRLKRKILYVPDFVLSKFSPVQKKNDGFHNAEDLFDDYAFKYKVVSAKELLDVYLNTEGSFYYLTTVKSCNKVMVNVVNGRTGAIIYSDFPKLFSYNVKPKNLKQLGKKIEKMK